MNQITKITIDVKECAALIGVSTHIIYKLCREGQIPHMRIRKRLIFHRNVIEAWLRNGQEA